MTCGLFNNHKVIAKTASISALTSAPKYAGGGGGFSTIIITALCACFGVGGLFLLPDSALAQSSNSWQFSKKKDFEGNDFVEAGICGTGSASRYCVSLTCQPRDSKTARWHITIPSGIYTAEDPDVTWTIDGKSFTFLMDRFGPDYDGLQFYHAYFDSADVPNVTNNPRYKNRPSLSQSVGLRERLKTGNRLTINDMDFSSPSLSLRGSKTALSKWQVACFQAVADDDDPVEEANRAWNAVLTMAAKQNCIATEEEIFDAYVDVGGGDSWTAGLIISNGAEDGSLIVVSKTPDFTYRITGCTPQ